MRRVSVAIFLIALAIRLVLLFGFHRYEFGHAETVMIAMSLARNGSFADPYSIPTGPTAHTAPAYPVVTAPFYMLFPDPRQADLARFAFNAAGTALLYALLPLVTEALGLGWRAGALAGILGAVIPLHYWVECANDSESSWTALFLVVAAVWFARYLKGGRQFGRDPRFAGCLWGVGLLLSPTVGPVLGGFLAIAAARRKLPLGWAVRFTAMLLAVLAPWLIRNAVMLGGPTFIRDNFGLELFISNHDGATALADVNYGMPYWRMSHPDASPEAALQVKTMGELAFERLKFKQALEWIRLHPRRFGALTLSRTFRFWFPQMPRMEWAFWAVTILAGFGWALMFQRARPAAVILGTLLATYSALFCVLQVTLRYEHPIWWVLVVLAAWPVSLIPHGGDAPVHHKS